MQLKGLWVGVFVLTLAVAAGAADPRVIPLKASSGSRWVPDEISVAVGETVIFRVTAERSAKGPSYSKALHGFQILSDNGEILVQEVLRADGKRGTPDWNVGSTDITWTAPTVPGTYELMCHRPCGPEHDRMTGKIRVE